MNFPTGSMTALITPIKNSKIDTNSFAKLIKRQIENGTDWVVPVGTTGESATLTHNEHKELIEVAIDTVKGTNAKVLAGAGSNSTHEAVDLAQFAEKSGADAILTVSPYYNKPTQEGLFQHYSKIANSIEIPLVLYNVPGRTASDIEPETVIRILKDAKNVRSIKEATGSIERTIALRNMALANNLEIDILSGDDAINYPILANGGKGVISVTANILPQKISDLVHSALKQDFTSSEKISNELYELNKTLFIESNPIPIKAVMYLAGLIDTLEYRLPLVPPSKENLNKLETVLKKYI
jgi:4-hydroxy-tetrahydrodipicolinate synthase